MIPITMNAIAEEINREMAIACGWQPVAAQWHDGWFKYTLLRPGEQTAHRQLRPATDEPERWQEARYWPDYLSDCCALSQVYDAIEAAGVYHVFMRVLLCHERNTYRGAFDALREPPKIHVRAALLALGRWRSAWNVLYGEEADGYGC